MVNKGEAVLAELPDDWQEVMLQEYKQGASDTEIRAELSMTYKMWTKCMLESVEFNNTVVIGRQFSKAWWLKAGRVNLSERNFNAILWYKNMQNRFAWSDKQQSNIDAPSADEEEGYDDDEADQRITELLDKTKISVN